MDQYFQRRKKMNQAEPLPSPAEQVKPEPMQEIEIADISSKRVTRLDAETVVTIDTGITVTVPAGLEISVMQSVRNPGAVVVHLDPKLARIYGTGKNWTEEKIYQQFGTQFSETIKAWDEMVNTLAVTEIPEDEIKQDQSSADLVTIN
jgi:hypothetical protein